MFGLKYIIISTTSEIDLSRGIVKIKVLGMNPNLDWIDPTDKTLKSQWMYFQTRTSAEKMIKTLQESILYKDVPMVSYGVNK